MGRWRGAGEAWTSRGWVWDSDATLVCFFWAPLLAGQLYAVDPRLPLVVALTTTAPLAVGAFGLHRLGGRMAAVKDR